MLCERRQSERAYCRMAGINGAARTGGLVSYRPTRFKPLSKVRLHLDYG